MSSEGRRTAGAAPLVILSLVNLVDQIDVSVLRGVLPILKDEWSLSDFKLGLLGFAFIFIHALAVIPSGWIADRYRRTRAIGFTLLSWSALSAIAAAALNYWNLFVARALLGVGQAIDDPSSTSLLADYYPPNQRGRVYSVQQVSTFVGGGLGLALGGVVGAALGWRWAFLLVGVPGSVIALLVFRLRDPRRGESDGITLDAPVQATRRESGLTVTAFLREAGRELSREIRMIFGIPTMRYILVGVATLLFTVSGVGYWLAVYHERYSGMTAGQAAAVTGGLLAIGGLIGTFVGGSVADRVYGRHPSARITAVATSIFICIGTFLISYNVPVVPRLALQFVGVAAIASAAPGIRASMMDVVPAQSRGMSSSAFALSAAVFGTAMAPPLVGWISDLTSLQGAFYIVSPPILVGTLVLLRARHTLGRDVQAIVESMAARTTPETIGTPADEPKAPEPA